MEVTVRPHLHLYSPNRAAHSEDIPAGEPDQLRVNRSDAMCSEMAGFLHPYVLLNFLSSSEAADKPLALAVIFHQDLVPIIVIRHDWQMDLDAEDREYLIELMDDWARTPPERVLALFRQLEGLSIGPLRATDTGIATAEALEFLMYAILGRGRDPGQWTM